MIDTLKGAALIATFLGVLTIFATLVMLWESVWRTSVEPVRGAVYDAQLLRLGTPFCLRFSWWHWRKAGCRLI